MSTEVKRSETGCLRQPGVVFAASNLEMPHYCASVSHAAQYSIAIDVILRSA
jgi:hypothetical protein